MGEFLKAVRLLKDGRYRVERSDGVGMSLPPDQWKEAVAEIDRQEMFRKITTGRQTTTGHTGE
jgi:hypothetical protein